MLDVWKRFVGSKGEPTPRNFIVVAVEGFFSLFRLSLVRIELHRRVVMSRGQEVGDRLVGFCPSLGKAKLSYMETKEWKCGKE